MPPVRAPLSDPRATPAESLGPAVDAALRAVCTAILQVGGVDSFFVVVSVFVVLTPAMHAIKLLSWNLRFW